MTPRLALLLEARRRHGTLCRCGGKATIWEGFVEQRGRLELWVNSVDGNTHLIWAPLDCPSLPAAPVF